MGIAVFSRQVSTEVMAVVHNNIVASEQIVKIVTADLVVSHMDALRIDDAVHVILANEGLINLKATTVLKWCIQVLDYWRLHFGLMTSLQMLYNDWLIRAHFESISGLHAVSQEHLDSNLVAQIDMGIHTETVAVPEVVKVALADPLGRSLRMVQVFSMQLHALVVFHMLTKLLVACHGVAKESVLVSRLVLLVLH